MRLEPGKYYLYADEEGSELFKVLDYDHEESCVKYISIHNTIDEYIDKDRGYIYSGSGYDKLAVEVSAHYAKMCEVVYGQ